MTNLIINVTVWKGRLHVWFVGGPNIVTHTPLTKFSFCWLQTHRVDLLPAVMVVKRKPLFQYMLFHMNAPKEWVCLSAPYLHLLQFSLREQKFCQILVCPPLILDYQLSIAVPFMDRQKVTGVCNLISRIYPLYWWPMVRDFGSTPPPTPTN